MFYAKLLSHSNKADEEYQLLIAPALTSFERFARKRANAGKTCCMQPLHYTNSIVKDVKRMKEMAVKKGQTQHIHWVLYLDRDGNILPPEAVDGVQKKSGSGAVNNSEKGAEYERKAGRSK